MNFLLFDKIAAERGDGLLPEIRERLSQPSTRPSAPELVVPVSSEAELPRPVHGVKQVFPDIETILAVTGETQGR